MLGQSYEQAGEFEKAKSIYLELHKIQPDNVIFFYGVNRTYIALKDYKKSISLLEERLKVSPNSIDLYGYLGASYYLDGNEKAAFAAWDNGIKTAPNSETTYRAMANFALDRRAFEKAIDILKRGKAISKDPKTSSYELANLYTLTMQFKEAAEEYSGILLTYPNQLDYVESKVFTYMLKPEALDITIKVFEDRKKESVTAFYYLLSYLYLEQKNYDKAFEYYLWLDRKLNREGAELFSLAQRVLNDGNDGFAAKVFGYILDNYPSNSSFYSASKLGYAKSLEAKYEKDAADSVHDWLDFNVRKTSHEGDYKKILEIYSGLIKLYPYSEVGGEAYYRIGKIYFEKLNNPEKAKENFDHIIRDFTLANFYSSACNLMSQMYLVKGDLDLSLEYLGKITSNNRSSEDQKNEATLNKAKINYYKKDFSGAKRLLEGIMTNLQDNSANDALELSLLINTTIDDSLGLSEFASAELLAERNLYAEASEKFRLISLKKQNFVLSSLALIYQAEIQLAGGQYNEALETLNKTSEEKEPNIYADKALYLKAKTYQYMLNDIPKAIDNYQSLLAKFPSSLYLEDSRTEINKLRNKSS
jgi:tetratricopeptide (TPR) repeat protein